LNEGRFAGIAGALLLGGASERMGADKAALEIGGEASALRTARLLASLFEEVLLVGGAAPPGTPGRSVPDPPGPRCALRGLVAALDAARAPRVLVVATDLPGLTADLLLALIALPEADAALPRGPSGRHEPLCALYRRESVLPLARARLAAGKLALHGLLDELPTTTLLQGAELAAFDPDGAVLANANTPEEWARARARLEGGARR
jgi:molybdopterin-guanine dinucleotide biosynthesis protein A